MGNVVVKVGLYLLKNIHLNYLMKYIYIYIYFGMYNWTILYD